jgi:hypothetical protein
MNSIRAQWNVTSFMMHERWTDLEARLISSTEPTFKHIMDELRSFFEGLESHVQFCDREGVILGSAIFKEHQTWIDFLRGEASL